MTDREFLWCALNLMLDDQETLDQLCPSCRAEAMQLRCPVCGAHTGGGSNQSFDWERFRALSRGEKGPPPSDAGEEVRTLD